LLPPFPSPTARSLRWPIENGLGERAGNAALEEIVTALRIRADEFGGVETAVRSEELACTSRLVSRLTGYPVQ
jgi:2-isopropylmalate synthase